MIICINRASMSNIICDGAGKKNICAFVLKIFVHLSKLYFAAGRRSANIFK